MSKTQAEKAAAFRALHQRGAAFVIPNPWDAGSARVLAGLGFEALATTSGGFAMTLGLRDGAVTRDAMLAHAKAVVEATDLPVSADLENGYGDAPEAVAETVRRAAGAGLVGCSIEDYTPAGNRLYDKLHAVERVRAAVAAARALPFPFTLTARSENFLRGKPDLADTVGRLQAFQEAGADVLYAPGLSTLADIRAICSAVSRPVNVMVGAKGQVFPVKDLADAGVLRISLGPRLFQAAMSGFLTAAREIREQGTFGFVERAVGLGDVLKLMSGPAR